MRIGNRNFDREGHTYVMGILNVTPDSFSDGGRYHVPDSALFRAETLIKEGTDILDVGGESTRPGHIPVSAEEECARVLPVIAAIKARFDVAVSVDTYKGAVAREAALAGADLINDVRALSYDDVLGRVAAEKNLPVILMHSRAVEGSDFFVGVLNDMKAAVQRAKNYGIKEDAIILDPGVGFAKNAAQNLTVIHRLRELRDLGFPILLGASKKSVIGEVLSCAVDSRLEGTLATTAAALESGAMFVRVHDVLSNVRFIKMWESIRGEKV